jgi:hypothetical protein
MTALQYGYTSTHQTPKLTKIPGYPSKYRCNVFWKSRMGVHRTRQKLADFYFLDLTIALKPNGTIGTITLFEKKLNLYLYIPPHSAHPPEDGVTSGLLFGSMIQHIFRLTTETADQKSAILLTFSDASKLVNTKLLIFYQLSLLPSPTLLLSHLGSLLETLRHPANIPPPQV